MCVNACVSVMGLGRGSLSEGSAFVAERGRGLMAVRGATERGGAENSLFREAYANARWANQLIFITGDILLDHPTGNRDRGEWF